MLFSIYLHEKNKYKIITKYTDETAHRILELQKLIVTTQKFGAYFQKIFIASTY